MSYTSRLIIFKNRGNKQKHPLKEGKTHSTRINKSKSTLISNLLCRSLSKQNVRLPGRLRGEDNSAGDSAQADHKSIPQIHPLAGHPIAQGAGHEAERVLPYRVRVRARVQNHQGEGDTAAREKSQSP